MDPLLNELDNSIQSEPLKSKILRLIEGIINNILDYPNEQKYKKLNKKKFFQKFPYQSLFDILDLIGFKSVPNCEYIKYNENITNFDKLNGIIYSHYGKKYSKVFNALTMNIVYNIKNYKDKYGRTTVPLKDGFFF